MVTNGTEQAALLALTEAATSVRLHWYEVSDLAERVGGALALVTGSAELYEDRDVAAARSLAGATSIQHVEDWERKLARVLDSGTWLTTVLDDTYPMNLRKIYNRPPFLFVRGTLSPECGRSVAVVGTRRASPEGRRQARELAVALAERGVTVVTGLAAGIDTEAHRSALESGGRTIAVIGTGIDKVYPAENRELSAAIPHHGAVVSQFWPGAPPRRENFPLRNVVTSGIAVGTVVVEASSTSGAKMQARLALEHGKRLFLVEPLVLQEEWAQRYSRRPGVTVVKSVRDVVEVLDAEMV